MSLFTIINNRLIHVFHSFGFKRKRNDYLKLSENFQRICLSIFLYIKTTISDFTEKIGCLKIFQRFENCFDLKQTLLQTLLE